MTQEIGTLGVERDMQRDHYWRLVYENDFFAATDRYYTQGLRLEVVAPGLRRLPVAPLLLRPKGMLLRHGLVFEDDGYTASDLKRPGIIAGDHPYAGTKQLRAFVTATDPERGRRVVSGLTLGIIGPAAGGKQIQTFLHRVTGNTIPQGWSNQIRNDLILNYDVGVSQRVARVGRVMSLNADAGARLGTLNTSATVGATLMLGWLGSRSGATGDASPALNQPSAPGPALYVYAKPAFSLSGFDATLQGGLLNRSSPYTIPSQDLRRGTYAHHVGVVLRFRGGYVEYFRGYASRSFRTGRDHQTGGLVIGWPLGR